MADIELQEEMEDIDGISQETIAAIKQKSAYGLPDNPSESGYSAAQIKEALYNFVTDNTVNEVSVITEINRIVDEANTKIKDALAGKIDKSETKSLVDNDLITKLEGIDVRQVLPDTSENANKYLHTDSRGNPEWKSIEADLSSKENTSNKVALGSTNTDMQYPTAKSVYDECVNIREVAEGKSNVEVISYAATAPTTDTEAQINFCKADGSAFTNLADFNTYVSGKTLANGLLNSNNASVSLLLGSYYFLGQSSNVKTPVYLGSDFAALLPKKGDILLITETDVPDRWVTSSSTNLLVLSKLETSKIDLNDYYTKTQVDSALSGKQATLVSGTNIKTINGQSILGGGDFSFVTRVWEDE